MRGRAGSRSRVFEGFWAAFGLTVLITGDRNLEESPLRTYGDPTLAPWGTTLGVQQRPAIVWSDMSDTLGPADMVRTHYVHLPMFVFEVVWLSCVHGLL